jgi:hypothetical protein
MNRRKKCPRCGGFAKPAGYRKTELHGRARRWRCTSCSATFYSPEIRRSINSRKRKAEREKERFLKRYDRLFPGLRRWVEELQVPKMGVSGKQLAGQLGSKSSTG